MIIFESSCQLSAISSEIRMSGFEMKIQIIFVELLREGTPSWRPVQAEDRGDESYRIIDPRPDDEVWAFAPGDTVKCKMHRFANSNSNDLLAHQKVDGKRNSP
jgi:hypothetical protein